VDQEPHVAERLQQSRAGRLPVRPDRGRAGAPEDRAGERDLRVPPGGQSGVLERHERADERDEDRQRDLHALQPRLHVVTHLVDEDQRDEADGEAPPPDQRVAADGDEDRCELEEDEAELDQHAGDGGDRRPDSPREAAPVGAARLDRLVVARLVPRLHRRNGSVSLLSDRKKQLRDEFIEARGYWSELWNSLLELDEDFFEAYMRFSSVPWKSGPLEPKVKELVYIAMDAAATHMYEPGIRQHVKQALEYGATGAELQEVLEPTATLGIHACTVGVPILVEELEAAGQPLSRELSDRQREVKADFERKRGYWNAFWDEMLILNPEFFAAYTEFSGVPWVSGVLEPKVKELIYT